MKALLSLAALCLMATIQASAGDLFGSPQIASMTMLWKGSYEKACEDAGKVLAQAGYHPHKHADKRCHSGYLSTGLLMAYIFCEPQTAEESHVVIITMGTDGDALAKQCSLLHNAMKAPDGVKVESSGTPMHRLSNTITGTPHFFVAHWVHHVWEGAAAGASARARQILEEMSFEHMDEPGTQSEMVRAGLKRGENLTAVVITTPTSEKYVHQEILTITFGSATENKNYGDDIALLLKNSATAPAKP